MEETFSAASSALPVKLFLAFGHHDYSDFARQMDEQSYAGFSIEYAQLYGEGHFTLPAEGLTKGLVSVFQA